jgi:hypothetical protein
VTAAAAAVEAAANESGGKKGSVNYGCGKSQTERDFYKRLSSLSLLPPPPLFGLEGAQRRRILTSAHSCRLADTSSSSAAASAAEKEAEEREAVSKAEWQNIPIWQPEASLSPLRATATTTALVR